MKRKIIIFIISIISMFVITGCGKVEQNNNQNQSVENKAEAYEEITNEELVKELMDKIDMPLWSKYYEIYYTDKIDAKDLPNDAKLLLGSALYRSKNKTATEMTTSEMKEQLQEIFGENISYKDESIDTGACYGDNMTLSNDTYTFDGGCGGMGPVDNYQTKLIQAKKYADKIEIIQKIAYLSYGDDWTPDSEYYERNIYTKKDGKKLGTENGVEEFDIEKYINQLDSYLYTFKLENNHYIFESVEKNKE